jgi:AcrR family transcriptional regulator
MKEDMTMANNASVKGSARDRLLTAAGELFYEEGVQTVGIDKIIERAGVAKASLYNTYGSKEELVKAYLASRHSTNADRITKSLLRYQTPRERLLGVFEAQGEQFSKPGFRGCAFAAATAEAKPGSSIEQAADDYRAWIRALFTDLAEQAGAAQPQLLGRQLHLLYDGAMLSARMDRDPTAAQVSRSAAAVLLDAAVQATTVEAVAE